jgi:hypothetical protein
MAPCCCTPRSHLCPECCCLRRGSEMDVKGSNQTISQILVFFLARGENSWKIFITLQIVLVFFRDQSFFPVRTVRSDHVAAVAFRKIRSHFLLAGTFFPPFFHWVQLSRTLPNTTQSWSVDMLLQIPETWKEYWQCWHRRHEHEVTSNTRPCAPEPPLAIHAAFTLYSGVKTYEFN